MNVRSALLLLTLWLAAQTGFAQPAGRIQARIIAEWSFDKIQNGPGLVNPGSIAIDPNGMIYIADTGNHRIVKLDSLGNMVKEAGGFGWDSENFDEPYTVDARNGLDLFIADHNNSRVKRYDRNLNYISSFQSGEEWDETLQFGFPRDAVLSSHGELFILDGDNDRILKLDVLGEPQVSFGDFDAGEGRLSQPYRMAMNKSTIYVTDTGAKNIVVYDSHGNYLHTIEHELLQVPSGIVVTQKDRIIVVEKESKLLMVFKTSGDFIGQFAIPSLDDSSELVDVAVWKGRVYILDRGRNKIIVMSWNE